jgi:hypothetical protein
MLVRLLYASRATTPLVPSVQESILEQSRAHNPKAGITGVLSTAWPDPRSIFRIRQESVPGLDQFQRG